MKKTYINKDKVIEAIISEPSTYDKENPFSEDTGWQLKLIVSFMLDGRPNIITINYNSEYECIEALKKLNLIEL